MIATAYSDEQQLQSLLPPCATDEELQAAAILADMGLTVTDRVEAIAHMIPNELVLRIQHVGNYLVILHRRCEDSFPRVGQREAQNLRLHAKSHGWTRHDVDRHLFRTYRVRGFTKLTWWEYLDFRRRTQFPPDKVN